MLPERIARVIEQFNPDLIALQELDVNRRWSRRMDQPRLIAQYLRLRCHFQPCITIAEEHYGIAVLSRYPFEIKKSVALLSCPQRGVAGKICTPLFKYLFEPRYAIWISVVVGGVEIYFVNTHLSLRPGERLEQVKSLLGREWLNMDSHKGPTIVCGDFNEGSNFQGYQLFKKAFDEVKSFIKQKSSKKTVFSYLSLFEVDHIFFNRSLSVESVSVPRTPLTRIASDHLPVIADFSLYGGDV